MKITIKKGLFRIGVTAIGVLLGILFAKSFSFLVVCALFSIGWVLYWLIGGFFNMD